MGMSVHDNSCVNRAMCGVWCRDPPFPPPRPAPCTWCQQDDGGDDQRADDQNDKKGDRYSLPVPLRRVTAHQLLQRERETERRKTWSETVKRLLWERKDEDEMKE